MPKPMQSDRNIADDSRVAGAPSADTDLQCRIAGLDGMKNGALRTAWREAWGADPPKGARKRFLMLGIAWKWQADRHGGFGPELTRRLTALDARGPIGSKQPETTNADPSCAARPGPCTRLVRDWRGERYEVHVTERGYLWRGRTFGSLSAVATEITGVSQNGPRFFGLRNNRRAG